MAWYRPSLDKIGQLAFIAMCVAVTAVGVQRLTARSGGPPLAPPPIPAGARLAMHPDLAPGPARASVVLALSATCQYCTASMPFYRQLAALDAVGDGRLRLGAVGFQPDADMRTYLTQHGLSLKTVIEAREAGVPVQATPTIVIVDAAGAVTRSWAGRLRPDEEAAVLKEITRLTSN